MMQIDEPWLRSDVSQSVCSALTKGGVSAFFVGGCVRNALLGAPVSDLDISTNAHPTEVIKLAQAAGIKALPTGIDHGTVTLVQDGIPFEVTTFRKDVATDGRRAVVAFADTMEEDARRRDFTMNALYADPAGQIFDPLDGLEDLKARRVRFIGSAENRIREDYLRTLRYFRFHAWYGDVNAGLDPDALAAIAANLDGLPDLSRERVGQELLKLLGAPDPAPALAAMRQSGALGMVLTGADDRALAPLVYLETLSPTIMHQPKAILRLAALGDADVVAKTLRLSKAQVRQIELLREAAIGTESAATLAYRHGAEIALGAVILRAALLETPFPSDLASALAQGSSVAFPISAHDLMPKFSGAVLGQTLKALESRWIESGFSLTKDELMQGLGNPED